MSHLSLPKLSSLTYLALGLNRDDWSSPVPRETYVRANYSCMEIEAQRFFQKFCSQQGKRPMSEESLKNVMGYLETSLIAMQGLTRLSDHEMNVLVDRGLSFRSIHPEPSLGALTSWTHSGADHVSDLFNLFVTSRNESLKSSGARAAYLLVYLTQLSVCFALETYSGTATAYNVMAGDPS